MGKRKAIFLGNGFTRALVKNVPTWGQLIGCFNSSDAVQQTIPYTFQYEMNYRIHYVPTYLGYCNMRNI